MAVKVEIGFMTTPTFGDGFILDDPVQGVLDSATYRLGGAEWVDVTDYATTVTIQRGRSRELDAFDAGTCSVTLRNETRLFDPLNTAGTYYGGIMLRCPLRITVNGTGIFYGFIDDYDITYDGPRTSEVTIQSSDAFSLLAQATFAARTPDAELSGARVAWALQLTEVRFPDDRIGSISNGSSTLGAFAIAAGTSVLDYFQDIQTVERGKLFVNAAGQLTFRGRGTIPASSGVLFSDTGTGIPYQDVQLDFGTEQFYNYVAVTRQGGTEQVASDDASITAYGVRGLSYTDVLLSSNGQALSMATALLGEYGEPELRVSSLTVNLDRLSTTKKNDVLGLDIGETVAVIRTPPGGGPAISVTAVIEGVSHDIDVDTHWVTLQLQSTAGIPLVLGDDTFGILGFNTLDY